MQILCEALLERRYVFQGKALYRLALAGLFLSGHAIGPVNVLLPWLSFLGLAGKAECGGCSGQPLAECAPAGGPGDRPADGPPRGGRACCAALGLLLAGLPHPHRPAPKRPGLGGPPQCRQQDSGQNPGLSSALTLQIYTKHFYADS